MSACSLSPVVSRWAVGLSVSLLVGQLVTWAFLTWLRKRGGLAEPKQTLPRWVIGTVERLVFTIFVALLPTAAITPMFAWLALKLASNWNHASMEDPDSRTFAMTAVLAGLVSMFFAFIGGVIARGGLMMSS
jgi:hypothetical protein